MLQARSVTLSSERLGFIAKMDVVEIGEGCVMPVDFKKGKRPHVTAGANQPERVQVRIMATKLRRECCGAPTHENECWLNWTTNYWLRHWKPYRVCAPRQQLVAVRRRLRTVLSVPASLKFVIDDDVWNVVHRFPRHDCLGLIEARTWRPIKKNACAVSGAYLPRLH